MALDIDLERAALNTPSLALGGFDEIASTPSAAVDPALGIGSGTAASAGGGGGGSSFLDALGAGVSRAGEIAGNVGHAALGALGTAGNVGLETLGAVGDVVTGLDIRPPGTPPRQERQDISRGRNADAVLKEFAGAEFVQRQLRSIAANATFITDIDKRDAFMRQSAAALPHGRGTEYLGPYIDAIYTSENALQGILGYDLGNPQTPAQVEVSFKAFGLLNSSENGVELMALYLSGPGLARITAEREQRSLGELTKGASSWLAAATAQGKYTPGEKLTVNRIEQINGEMRGQQTFTSEQLEALKNNQSAGLGIFDGSFVTDKVAERRLGAQESTGMTTFQKTGTQEFLIVPNEELRGGPQTARAREAVDSGKYRIVGNSNAASNKTTINNNMGATTAFRTKLQEAQRSSAEILDHVNSVLANYDESMLTIFGDVGKVQQALLKGLDTLAPDLLSEEQKQQVTKLTAAKKSAYNLINRRIQQITGAQMSKDEAARIRKEVPDWEKDGAYEFKVGLENLQTITAVAMIRNDMVMQRGVEKDFWDDTSLVSVRQQIETEYEANYMMVFDAAINSGIEESEARATALDTANQTHAKKYPNLKIEVLRRLAPDAMDPIYEE